MKDLKSQLNMLPTSPGVYLMKDKQGVIIYVGKAKNLKNRVTSYFRGFNSHSPKTQTLVVNIDDFEYIMTSTEVEALILEGNLIKKHQPRFNILLKDDKTYPYIKITNEMYPRVLKVRRVLKDGAHYFGPYTSAYDVNQIIDMIQKTFPIRQCNRDMSKKSQRPCLNYHIKQCLGPCKGNVGVTTYGALIEHIILFLSGKQDRLTKLLEKKMRDCAAKLDFEKAAILRNQLKAIERLTVSQKVSSASGINQDVIAVVTSKERACVSIFFVRSGLLIGREHFVFEDSHYRSKADLLAQFIQQFYSGTATIPKEILLSNELENFKLYEQWLSEKSDKKVYIKEPKRGEKKRLVEMVMTNAQDFLEKHYDRVAEVKLKRKATLSELQDLLHLDTLPKRIEAYDISNIMGAFSVGSMVVYEEATKKKSDYRRFKIKTIEGPNDYGSMMEVLYRRFRRGLTEHQESMEKQYAGFETLPNMLLIDGGKGQVSAVESVLSAMAVDIAVVGMVKDNKHRTRELLYRGQEYPLDRRSELYRFIYDIQEEVHRFAVSYHRSLRDKAMSQSILDDIAGVGAKRKKNLLKHFKTIEAIKKANLNDLLQVEGINQQVAEAVLDFFKQ